jgi:hypothetical protein
VRWVKNYSIQGWMAMESREIAVIARDRRHRRHRLPETDSLLCKIIFFVRDGPIPGVSPITRDPGDLSALLLYSHVDAVLGFLSH